jgi:putative heme iron utilization protein
MNEKPTSPIRPTDDKASALARDLMASARICALGVHEAVTGAPMVSRVAFGLDGRGQPITLVSELSQHTKALRQIPAASVLVGEPGQRGDPLNSPRLTLMARARFVEHRDTAYQAMADHYLATHPKAKLYIGFADFAFVVFDVSAAYLNGGFGKAFHLTPADLGLNGVKR